MNIYKKKEITEIKDVLVKVICDKCKKKFSYGKRDDKHCGYIEAELTVETEYQLIKDYWQTEEKMHLCYDCYTEFKKWLNEK